jgi:hypothetical protein
MNVQESNSATLDATNFLRASQQNASKFTLQLSQVLEAYFELIFKANEPIIYESKSKFGSVYWTVYDPVSGRKVLFDSETDVRVWLERRYYT